MMRIGPKMREAANYVAAHEGCSIFPVARHLHGWRKGHKYGYRAVHRAIAAGLISAHKVGGRYCLYARVSR